jgi:phosphomannomutase
MALMFSISGLRGVVGKDLNARIISRYAGVYGRYLGPGKVIIGRDTRGSGKVFRKAVIKALQEAACQVIDLGIVPTPTVLFMVRRLKAGGGIVITDRFQISKGANKVLIYPSGIVYHIQKIVKNLNRQIRPLKVGIDAVNGAGSLAMPMLMEKLGCTVHRLHCRFGPTFPRRPEPIPDNIRGLCSLVKKNKLDLGFAVDPDCDRLAIVDEKGRAIGEDKTLVLVTDHILSKTPGNVVTNLSTTGLMDFVVQKHKCRLYRTKVGEANVVSEMRNIEAVIGGEGNGGVIYPEINFTRDALVAAAIVVSLVNKRQDRLSRILAEYPDYYMIKRRLKIPGERLARQMGRLTRKFKGEVDTTDGLRITGQDYWLHVRPSQTEPLVRVIVESREAKKAMKYAQEIENILG